MKIYFDTTCWVRTVENPQKYFLQNEKTAIQNIIDVVEKNPDRHEIISSKIQVDQLNYKIAHNSTTQQQKNALAFVIAQIQTHTGNTSLTDPPSSNHYRNLLLQQTALPDREDAKQIAIAWIKESDYFVTTDWKTILNINTNSQIENALITMTHPFLGNASKSVGIIDPVSFRNLI